jgi:thioredoxin-related protein
MNGSLKDNFRKQIEVAANVGIIIVALAIGVTLIRNSRGDQSQPHQTIKIGSKLAVKDTNWGANGRSIVLALSTTCHFCAESSGFYQKVVRLAQQQHLHTIAVFPQSIPEVQAYLNKQGIAVDETKQAELSSLDINGTPTLLLVDENGIVCNVWIGKLSAEKEKDMLAKLTS